MTHNAPAPYYGIENIPLEAKKYYGSMREFKFGKHFLYLPALKVNNDTLIYVLNIMGGNPQEIKEYASDLSKGFYERFGIKHDGFISAEGKAIPLVYEVALQEKLPYTILRKSCKPYMGEKVLSARVKTITTDEFQELYLDNKDLPNIVSKNLVFVDDVISSGATLKACRKIVDMAGGRIVGCMVMALEGDYLPILPTFLLTRLPVVKFGNKEKAKDENNSG